MGKIVLTNRQRERQKTKRFNKQDNNFTLASRFFVHFFPVSARLRRENANFAFYGGRKQATTNFISLSEIRYGRLKFSFRRVRLHLTK